ncbi:hypothetical protein BDZ89DRAFT_317389 [Hymenopellis radicata]|nr:hypothetical protein BDZ89DRAFT_317389 [Hymenopellis radicata]
MYWSLLDSDGYVPCSTVPPPRSDRQIVFPAVEIYDQTRAARALLDRSLAVAYADARTAWKDNRDTLGPVYEYPEETCYSPTRAQAEVDNFLHKSDLLSQETRLKRPLRLTAPELDPEAIPIPRSLVWRQLGLMVPSPPHVHSPNPSSSPVILASLGIPADQKAQPQGFSKTGEV